ncbi:MATE efflux family protein [Basidiobolus meristosporus CBS 931.73]|uniref:MATE efflux family protein n=1 Tax=Basidiobolus meristosporus CBS 931.73 TaxID=1314790 RepID=A0A1Y1Z0H2_9FUNG|nr:MATE efflux family protein [Basidiobolus meristosporus CBS 931.73]|eukprot:ORY03719.1 MATE efflux family protein [Basidiobolus meristosporus CBS 931.73]
MTVQSFDKARLLGHPDNGKNGDDTFTTGTETTALLGDASRFLDVDPEKWYSEIPKEAYSILAKALPILLASFLTSLTKYGTVFSLGQLGTKELAACALGGVFEACTAVSPFLGVITALETLCSQAHTGSEDKHLLGVYLQRAIVIQSIAFLPIIWIWTYAEPILISIGQNPEIARMAATFIVWSIPAAICSVYAECVKRYLNAQGFMRASAAVSAITAPICLGLFYLLVVHPPTSLGFIGAPIAAGITNFLNLLLCVGYAMLIEGSQGWGGFSKKAFEGWWSFLSLGFPGMIMISSEVWAFEIITLATSYLGTVALAAQTIIGTTLMLFVLMSLGITIAACNRVGNLVGSAQPHRASLMAKVALTMGAVVGVLNCSIVWGLRDVWGYLYNHNDDVVAFVSNILPVIAVILLFQSVGSVCNGILRGLGKQKIGALHQGWDLLRCCTTSRLRLSLLWTSRLERPLGRGVTSIHYMLRAGIRRGDSHRLERRSAKMPAQNIGLIRYVTCNGTTTTTTTALFHFLPVITPLPLPRYPDP